jgi:hypothetical protein
VLLLSRIFCISDLSHLNTKEEDQKAADDEIKYFGRFDHESRHYFYGKILPEFQVGKI